MAPQLYQMNVLPAPLLCGAGTLACSAETHLGVDAFAPTALAQKRLPWEAIGVAHALACRSELQFAVWNSDIC